MASSLEEIISKLEEIFASSIPAKGDSILNSEALKKLRDYVLAGIRLPSSPAVFEDEHPQEILTSFPLDGIGEYYDGIRENILRISSHCRAFENNTLATIFNTGGKIADLASYSANGTSTVVEHLRRIDARGGSGLDSTYPRRLLLKIGFTCEMGAKECEELRKQVESFRGITSQDNETLHGSVIHLQREPVVPLMTGPEALSRVGRRNSRTSRLSKALTGYWNVRQTLEDEYSQARTALRSYMEMLQTLDKKLSQVHTALQNIEMDLSHMVDGLRKIKDILDDVAGQLEPTRSDTDSISAADDLESTKRIWTKVGEAAGHFQKGYSP